MNSTPKVQRAWTVVRRGTPTTALELKTDWPVPSVLKTGEVLVRVQAAGLNPIGYKLMRMLPNFVAKRPHATGEDFSGVIVNPNGTHFSEGDNVFGWLSSRQGTVTEYIKISAEHVVVRPSNISAVEAAGITVTAMTSYQALYEIGKLEAEQTVFVNGGSSAVGAYAIQLAKAKGAKVVATASGKNEVFVMKMGADEFINYTKGDLVKTLTINPPTTKYNLIFDAVGLIDPSLFTQSAKYLAPNGIFVSSGPMPSNLSPSELWKTVRTAFAVITPSWLGNVNRRYAMVMVKNRKEDLEHIQRLFANDTLKPIVDSVYNFEDVQTAYSRLLSRRATGKVIVKVDSTVN